MGSHPAKGRGGRRCLIVAGRGEPLSPALACELRESVGYGPWYTIGADSGAAVAAALGFAPDVVLGDMDSLPAADQKALRASGARFIVHPVDKDETDLHLALEYAFGEGFDEATVLFDSRGRLDHALGGIWAAYRYVAEGEAVYFADAGLEAALAKGPDCIRVHGPAGLTVSLIPISGPVTGITLSGMRYPLKGETLSPGESRGISNQAVEGEASIEFDGGILLVLAYGKKDKEDASILR